MLKVPTFRIDACLQSLSEGQDGFLDLLVWQVVPDRLQHFSQFGDVLRLRHTLLVSVHHRSPDVKVERFRSGELGGHSSFLMKSGVFGSSQSCAWCDV